MNSTACRPSGKFAAKLEDFKDRLVLIGPSRNDKEGWFFYTTLVKEDWTQLRTFPYAGVSFPKARALAKS